MASTSFAPGTPQPHLGSLFQRFESALARGWRAFDRWHARTSRHRRTAHLSPRLLKDIGIDPPPVRARHSRFFHGV